MRQGGAVLRRLTQNVYVQTAFHVAGGTGFGLFLSGFVGGALPWLAISLMGLAVAGHIVAVVVAGRRPDPNERT